MKRFILLSLVATMFATPMADTILSEDFEGGAIPTDWDTWVEGGVGDFHSYWEVNAINPYNSSYSAHHMYDYATPDMDNWMVTPTIDMSTWENISVSLWHTGRYPGDYGYSGLMVSDVASPTAGDFVELAELGAPPSTYTELIADASAYDFEANVTFAFRFMGENNHNLTIDDFLVEGDVGTGVEAASLGSIKAIYK